MVSLRVVWAVLAVAVALSLPPAPRSRRVRDLMAKMTLPQKVSMCHGTGGDVGGANYVGSINGIPSLGIPPLTMEDGPQGVADGVQGVTCFPSALTVAQSWDALSFELFANTAATEQRRMGTVAMLGPMCNLARVPQGGRNFESLGEDPFLASRLVEASVQGIQSAGVIANVKHFVLNNQEDNRGNVSAIIDDATLYDLYMQPFKAGVEAGTLSIMCRCEPVRALVVPNVPLTTARAVTIASMGSTRARTSRRCRCSRACWASSTLSSATGVARTAPWTRR